MSKDKISELERKTYVLNRKDEALCDSDSGYPIRKFQVLVFNGEEFTIQGISKSLDNFGELIVRNAEGHCEYKVRNPFCLRFRAFSEVAGILVDSYGREQQ